MEITIPKGVHNREKQNSSKSCNVVIMYRLYIIGCIEGTII